MFLQVAGLNTNISFLNALAGHDSFVSADVHTGFIHQHYDSLFSPHVLSNQTLCQAALGIVLREAKQMKFRSSILEDKFSPFSLIGGLRLNNIQNRVIKLQDDKDKGMLRMVVLYIYW